MSKDNLKVESEGLKGAFEGLFQEDSNTNTKEDKKMVIQEDEILKRGYKLRKSTVTMLDDYQYKFNKQNGYKIELSEIVEKAIREYLKEKL